MGKVLLITMPFSFANRPAIGISLLKSILGKNGIACDIRYMQLSFAHLIGQDLYFQIAQLAPRALIGEWLFAHHLFGDRLPAAELYVDKILNQVLVDFDPYFLNRLLYARELTGSYLDACMEAITWDQYQVVGFTSTFAQNLASLAMAKRIKEKFPEKIIVFGGANCEGEMGSELHRQFSFVDYVCSGESDHLFPELVRRLGCGEEISDLEGLIYRRGGETIANGSHAPAVSDLDALPLPDYDDYFAQLDKSRLVFEPDQMRLMVETSRGCWWGAKSQCIFCGVDTNIMNFRSKSGDRALDEYIHLANRYPKIKFIDATDKIMDMNYFQNLIPGLIAHNLGLNIFYFTKANMSRAQLRLLQRAGIRRIQPGIESLDSSVLQIMHKGCTSAQNIQLLKWAGELGLEVYWNFISGFPGEDPSAYQRMADLIPSIIHLQPPTGDANHVRLDRFSPYFREPEILGMKHIRPAAAYRFVYPFPEESLARIAYYFDFDYADGRQPEKYTDVLSMAIKEWRVRSGDEALLSLSSDVRLTLYDTRVDAFQREITLIGMAKVVYEYCEVGKSLSSILHYLAEREESFEWQVDAREIQELLNSLVKVRLMLHVDGRYLSLAIPVDEPVQDFVDSLMAAAQ